MIKANAKPLGEVFGFIDSAGKVLVLGCGGCVTVCQTGGEKEVAILAQALRLKAQTEGKDIEFIENTVTRQCEPEFIDPILETLDGVDAVVSIACGVGVNSLADRDCPVPVYPGVDTTFMGSTVEHGVWAEMCAGCGKCILDLTGGVCPVARCAKTILNGPCGGTQTDGTCEISNPENPTPCAWHLIVERLSKFNALDKLAEIQKAKDWSTARDGGPRRRVREDLRIEAEEETVESQA